MTEAAHPDTCDTCGHKVLLETPRAIGQAIDCEACWLTQEEE